MSGFWQTALVAQGTVSAVMVGLWGVSLKMKNVAIVDVFWGLAFAMSAWIAAAMNGPLVWRGALMLGLVTVWGLRLAGHLAWRNTGRPEDRRYAAMRRHHGDRFPTVSLFTVFLLQGLLVGLIAWPVVCVVTNRVGNEGSTSIAGRGSEPPGWMDGAGIGLWVLGFVFEVVGDWQMARFHRDPKNQGRVLDRGLWRYTRHPNYFGEFCIWWGYYLLAANMGAGWTVFSPALMTFLLLRVSGVSLLESTIGERRPEYARYQARTSPFWPMPPKNVDRRN